MTLDMEAELIIDGIHIPTSKDGETETCQLRPRTDTDNAFIQDLYARAIESQVFACPRSPELWEYEFNGRAADSGARMEWLLIEDTDGTRLGYVQHLQWCYDGWGEGKDTDANFMVTRIELKPGVGYLQLAPSLLRELWKKAKATPIIVESKASAPMGIQFMLGREHPVYSVLPKSIVRKDLPYSWVHPNPEPDSVSTAYPTRTRKTSYRHCCRGLHRRTQDKFLSQRHPLHIRARAHHKTHGVDTRGYRRR